MRVDSSSGSGALRSASTMKISTAIAVMLYGTAPNAFSQEQQSGTVSSVEQIIVTASRREQALEDVPYALTAVGQGQLDNTGVTDIASLTNQVPGLSMQQYGARSTLRLVLPFEP